jgi:type IV pilus assembly protein PilA
LTQYRSPGQSGAFFWGTGKMIAEFDLGLSQNWLMKQPCETKGTGRTILMRHDSNGFTLIELMIVVAIIGILASLAVSVYQTYTVRGQVAEGITLASSAKAPVVDAFSRDAAPPAGRVEAGLSAAPTDSAGSYVSQVDIDNGRIDIMFGNRAHADIQGDTLSLTPYLTDGNSIVWRCGSAPPPDGQPIRGGGEAAVYQSGSLDPRYLPSPCR